MRALVVAGCLILVALSATRPSRAATCTITTYNEDVIQDATRNCAEIILNGINVPAGVTLRLDLSQGARLVFQGTTTWEFFEWNGPLANITGTDIEITGAPGHVLDAKGNLWWDGRGEAGGTIKPVFFVVHGLRNSVLRNITTRNTPYHAFWIEDSDGVIAEDFNIDSSDGEALGKNTDGFNVWKSNNVTIRRIAVYNQDDCVALKSGTNLVVSDSYCYGGHGLSIGSVGGRDYNIVENVTVTNSVIENSDNGVRIKTVYGATGSVTNVTYENITLSEINKYGITVVGNYGSHDPPTDGVPVKHFILRNVTGTVKKTGSNVYIWVKNATDWQWYDVDVKGGEEVKECDGIPEDSGITC